MSRLDWLGVILAGAVALADTAYQLARKPRRPMDAWDDTNPWLAR